MTTRRPLCYTLAKHVHTFLAPNEPVSHHTELSFKSKLLEAQEHKRNLDQELVLHQHVEYFWKLLYHRTPVGELVVCPIEARFE